MATLFVRHAVKDFKSWKSHYDSFDNERKGMGVTAHGVYQSDGNPNDVTVYHEFKSMDEAKKFAGSARLKEVMQQAGVVGSPDMWFTKRA